MHQKIKIIIFSSPLHGLKHLGSFRTRFGPCCRGLRKRSPLIFQLLTCRSMVNSAFQGGTAVAKLTFFIVFVGGGWWLVVGGGGGFGHGMGVA